VEALDGCSGKTYRSTNDDSRCSGWSPKDNLAHLSEWMKALMGVHMDRRPSHEVLGVSEDMTKGWDMEIINPVLFERNRIVRSRMFWMN